MSDVSSLERCLSEVHVRLAVLADALGGVDAEGMEAAGRDLVEVVTRLRACAAHNASRSSDAVALASASVHWQLERCRRLGLALTRTPGGAVPAYAPDGRSRLVPARRSTIEVLG